MQRFWFKLAGAALATATGAMTLDSGGKALTEWLSISEWSRCGELARPGFVFEIRNADGLSLFAPCSPAVPQAPWDWKSAPVEFRVVPETPAERSPPIPKPE